MIPIQYKSKIKYLMYLTTCALVNCDECNTFKAIPIPFLSLEEFWSILSGQYYEPGFNKFWTFTLKRKFIIMALWVLLWKLASYWEHFNSTKLVTLQTYELVTWCFNMSVNNSTNMREVEVVWHNFEICDVFINRHRDRFRVGDECWTVHLVVFVMIAPNNSTGQY